MEPFLLSFCKLLLDKIIFLLYNGNVSGNVTGLPKNNFNSKSRAMRRSKSSVTIHDVAQAAGVSVSTVSRVLNGKDDVADDTLEKVQRVIENLGYTSSLAAKSMRSRKTNVIGLITPDVGDAFSIEVMKGVNQAIVQFGYDLITYTGGDSTASSWAAREQKYISLLNGSITDGIIIVAPTTLSTCAAFRSRSGSTRA
jgi:LacI family transcriptional regulator